METFYETCITAGLPVMPALPIIDGTEDSHYFFVENDKEFWKFERDFPNCLPPEGHKRLWIEFRAPEKVVSIEEGITEWGDNKPLRWGFRIKYDRAKAKAHILTANLYEEYKGSIPYASKFALSLFVNAEGRITKFPNGKGPVLLSGPENFINDLNAESKQSLLDSYATLLQPALLTICRMNGYA
jgi:hypothetical protein